MSIARTSRRGLTMLELVIASSLMAVILTAVGTLLRAGYFAWTVVDYDQSQLDAAHAAMRHLVRNLRQAQSVSAISASSDTSGAISLLMPSGQTVAYDHNAGTSVINYGVTTANSLLAERIVELSLTGYKADAVTVTAVPAEIQSVKCTIRTALLREASTYRVVSAWVWLRSW